MRHAAVAKTSFVEAVELEVMLVTTEDHHSTASGVVACAATAMCASRHAAVPKMSFVAGLEATLRTAMDHPVAASGVVAYAATAICASRHAAVPKMSFVAVVGLEVML